MSTTTPINGWTVPDLTDSPNIVTAVANPVNQIDARVVPIFATATARNSAIPSPAQGQCAYVSGTGELYLWNGSAWIGVGPRVGVAAHDDTQSNNTTLTNTVYLPAMSVEANSIYLVAGSFRWLGATGNGNIKFQFNAPTGNSGAWTLINPTSTATFVYSIGHAYGSSADYGSQITTPTVAQVTGTLVTASTAGSLQVQFASNTSPGGSWTITLAAYSCISLHKVG